MVLSRAALMIAGLSLALAGSTLAQVRDVPGLRPGSGRISGRVSLEEAGQRQPLRRAAVTLSSTTVKSMEGTVATDAQGEFVFDRLSPGTYRVTVRKAGFVAISATADHVLEAAGDLRVDLDAQRAGAVEGRFIDDRGVPIGRLQVAADLVTPLLAIHAPSTYRANTDDLGRFRIHTLPPGQYRVHVVSPRSGQPLFFPGTEELSEASLIQVGSGATVEGMQFNVPAGSLSTAAAEISAAIEREFLAPESPGFDSRISGRVTRSDVGLPVAGATVTLSSSSGVPLRTVLTDGDGQFAFLRLSPGKYNVAATAPGFITVTTPRGSPSGGGAVTIASGARVRVDPELLPASAIEIRVVDEFGDPAPGVVLQISQRSTGNPMTGLIPQPRPATDRTDDRGWFRASRLLPGEYFIAALPAPFAASGPAAFAPTFFPGVGSAEAATPIQLGAGVDAQISFVLGAAKAVTVSGFIQNQSGQPLASTSVVLLPARSLSSGLGGGIQTTSVAAKDGSFVFRNIPEGTYLLQGFTGGAFGTMDLTVAAASEAEMRAVVLTLKPLGTARGRIHFDGTAPPPPGRSLMLAFRSAESTPLPGSLGPFGREIVIADNGTFEIRDIPGPGLISQPFRGSPWILSRVLLHGRDITDVPSDFQGGDTAGLQVVLTTRVGSVAGTVRDATDPIPGATVLIFGADNESPYYVSRTTHTTRTNDQGNFELRGVLPGRYYATAPPAGRPMSAVEEFRKTATLIAVAEGPATKVDLTRVR